MREEFDRALRAVFEDKTDELTPHHREMLKRLWDSGRNLGHEEGRARGHQEFEILFTRCLSGLPTNEVFRGHNDTRIELLLQKWVLDAFDAVLRCATPKEAYEKAGELRESYDRVKARQREEQDMAQAVMMPMPERYRCEHCGAECNMMGMGRHEEGCPRA